MKKILLSLTLLFASVAIVYSNGALLDLTDVYLTNADFSDDVHNKATDGTNYFGNDGTFDDVAGWDREKYGWGVAATYSYGHEYTLHDKAVPVSDSEGNTEGATLGVVNAWGGWVKYTQSVVLPAGNYEVIYNVYNSNTGINTINYTGFVAKDGTEYLSSVSTFPSATWSKDTIRFTLSEVTEGKIQLGFGSANSGSGDKAAPFIDQVKVLSDANNTMLASLSIAEDGILFPEFSPLVTSYDFYGDADLDNITITASVLDTNNDLSITDGGNVEIVDGKAIIALTVTPISGEAKVYTVNVSLEEKELINVTKAYLINSDFEDDVHNKATRGTDFFGDDGTYDDVLGWSTMKDGWGVAATYSYGHNYSLHNKTIPATDPDGRTEGAALGIINAWGGWAKYTQSVVLPAGIYEICYDAFNANTGTNTINYTGFVADGGVEELSAVNTFPSMQWTRDTIRFTLAKETSGIIQLGIGSANSGSADKAGLFFDGIKIYSSVNDIESYRVALNALITKAQGVNDAGGFYIQLGVNLQSAIQAADAVKNSDTLDEILSAMESINSALAEIEKGLSDYVNLAAYIADVDIAVNSYERTDLSAYLMDLQTAYDDQSWDDAKINSEIAKKDSLFYAIELASANEKVFKIKQRIDVDYVESSFPVNYDQEIVGNHHFISYYDSEKNFCVGYRTLDETSFKKVILNSKVAWDSHNFIEMIVDNEGYIHISGNMHNVQLNYWRSKKPYDASEFEQLHAMVGTEEDNTTYPHFLLTNSGDLLFHYRYGWSGNGYEVYNIWDPTTKKWSRFLDIPLIDGEGKRNAYMNGPYYEDDGYYHLYWVWRETPDAASNHTFSYARSKDLKSWESASGEDVASPIVFAENKLKVDISTKTYGTGTLNNLPKHVLDSENRIVLCNMKYDALGNSQIYAYRLNADSTWDEKCITNWLYRFQFGGGGSLDFEINLYGMDYLGNGEIGVNYYHSQYGDGTLILDEATLETIAIREKERAYPEELDAITITGTYASPLKTKVNKSGNYILRWETMPDNNDRMPSGTLPPYIMMEMIELESDTNIISEVETIEDTRFLEVVQQQSNLLVTGVEVGAQLSLYSVNGMHVRSMVALDTECRFPAPYGGVYVLVSEGDFCKVLVRN